jgi:hypothetical protein
MEVYPQGSPRGGENENPNLTDPRLPTNGNGDTTTTAVCRCGKTCKNSRGLKIHQARMKCLENEHVSQRTDATSDETQEEPSQEAPHSAQSLRVPLTVPPSLLPQAKVRIKWPQACKTAVWRQFDEDVDKVLEATEKGDVDRRLQAMTTIISSLAQERFGAEEKRSTPTTYSMNHRAAKIHKIRQELKSLKKRYKEASEEQRPPLEELRAVLRKRLMTLRRAEWHRRRRKERSRKRASFIANPFGFTKQLLGQKRDGKLLCSKEEIDQHLHSTYSDPLREEELGQCNILVDPPPPTKEFDSREPTKWNPIQGLQELPLATQATLEDHSSHLEKRKGGTTVEIC